MRENKGRQNVQIVLVGYPNLLTPATRQYYVLRECRWGEWFSCEEFVDYNAGEEILRTARVMADVQKKAVDNWNKSHPQITPKTRYIDSIPHLANPCPTPKTKKTGPSLPGHSHTNVGAHFLCRSSLHPLDRHKAL